MQHVHASSTSYHGYRFMEGPARPLPHGPTGTVGGGEIGGMEPPGNLGPPPHVGSLLGMHPPAPAAESVLPVLPIMKTQTV